MNLDSFRRGLVAVNETTGYTMGYKSVDDVMFSKDTDDTIRTAFFTFWLVHGILNFIIGGYKYY